MVTDLLGVEAGVGVVENFDVKSSGIAKVFVAAGAPMLPLANLLTASLLPHLVGVVEAHRLVAVVLQREISVPS